MLGSRNREPGWGMKGLKFDADSRCLPFRIWDDGVGTVVVNALVSDFSTASAAYEEAVKRHPGKRVILRRKARVIIKESLIVCDLRGTAYRDRFGEGQAASLALRDLTPRQTVVTELADDAT